MHQPLAVRHELRIRNRCRSRTPSWCGPDALMVLCRGCPPHKPVMPWMVTSHTLSRSAQLVLIVSYATRCPVQSPLSRIRAPSIPPAVPDTQHTPLIPFIAVPHLTVATHITITPPRSRGHPTRPRPSVRVATRCPISVTSIPAADSD